MNIEQCYELSDITKSRDYLNILYKCEKLISDVIGYVTNVDVVDEPSYMLESIKNCEEILEKMKCILRILEDDKFAIEDLEDELYGFFRSLEKYEIFVKNMDEVRADTVHIKSIP